jgi:hypothetical protein
MKVIHFTEGASEHFESSQVSLTKFILLLQGAAETYITCLHFLSGASLVELPSAQECALCANAQPLGCVVSVCVGKRW